MIVNVVLIVFHAQKFIAIVTAIVFELIESLKNFTETEVKKSYFYVFYNRTLINEHTRQARNPLKSLGIESKDIVDGFY